MNLTPTILISLLLGLSGGLIVMDYLKPSCAIEQTQRKKGNCSDCIRLPDGTVLCLDCYHEG